MGVEFWKTPVHAVRQFRKSITEYSLTKQIKLSFLPSVTESVLRASLLMLKTNPGLTKIQESITLFFSRGGNNFKEHLLH